MWNFDKKSLHEFKKWLTTLSTTHQLFVISFLLLAFLYPGHNQLQTIVINPGIVRSYEIPNITPTFYPMHDNVKAPFVSARSVVIQDVHSKTLIYAKSPDAVLIPASTTKIMTALVALDHWDNLETIIEVKNEDRAVGQTIELKKGQKITLKYMLS